MNKDFITQLGLEDLNSGTQVGQHTFASNQWLSSLSPVDGKLIGKVSITTRDQYEQVIEELQQAFKLWRKWPAPKRGEVVRVYGNLLRENKEALGTLVSYEMGKSFQNAW